MSKGIKLLRNQVLVKQITVDNKTSSGIILATDTKEKPFVGEVVGIGDEVKEVRIGDTAAFSKYAGAGIKDLLGMVYKVDSIEILKDASDLIIMNEEDVLFVIRESE